MKRISLVRKSLAASLLGLGLAGTALADGHLMEEVFWERGGADFSNYSKVLVKPLDLRDVKVLKPVWEQDSPDEWTFEGGVGEEIQDLFMTNITSQLGGEGGFEIVTEEGPDTIQLEVEFLSITPYTKPGSETGDRGYEITTLGSGDVHLSAELRDSTTGAILMLVEGERQIGTEYKELTPENHVANLEATFKEWGQRVREYVQVKQAQ